MKYLPSLILGILFLFILDLAFSIAAEHSPILGYLTSTSDLNSNSREYWLLALHDSMIVLLISFALAVAYKLLLPKFPFNLLAAVLIQLPIIIYTLDSPREVLNFSSTYHSATSTVELISFFSIGFVFFALIAYNKKINKDT